MDYNTLEKVIGFVQTTLANSAIVDPTADDPQAETADQILSAEGLVANTEIHDGSQTILRRIPKPILRPKLDLCLPTGVILGEGKRVLIIEGEHEAGEALSNLLLSRNVSVLRAKVGHAGDLNHQIETWVGEGRIDGLFFIAPLSAEIPLNDMSASQWIALLDTESTPYTTP